MIERYASKKILKLLDFFPVVLIVGARQTGKTKLCSSLFPDWNYFDLELEGDNSLLRENPELFFQQYSSEVIIDEAQDFPEIFRVLRSVVDLNRSQKGRFVLTGSSSPELLHEAAESLAGRVGIVELGTLMLSEKLEQPLSQFFHCFEDSNWGNQKQSLLELEPRYSFAELTNHLARGGYPEPALVSSSEHWKAWMSNYIRTFVERDVRRLYPRLDTVRFRRFVRILGSVSGNILNKADLAQAVGVSEVTITDYLDIADKTYLWRTIPSFHRNILKSVIKSPKGIIRDCGLGTYFRGYHEVDQLLHSTAIGPTFEGFVVEELQKGFSYALFEDLIVSHFRTRAGAEVDIILEGSFGVLPIEVKYSSSTTAKDVPGLRNFIERHKLSFGIIVNNSSRVELIDEKVIQIPVGVL